MNIQSLSWDTGAREFSSVLMSEADVRPGVGGCVSPRREIVKLPPGWGEIFLKKFRVDETMVNLLLGSLFSYPGPPTP